MLKENLLQVEQNIKEACKRANRKRSEVTLISVSKTKPIETLKEAYDLGVRVFGENKVQELEQKIPAFGSDVSWHMIGHLQRNKVKYIVGKVDLIHSVDSLRLAEEIQKESEKKNVVSNILIEVNVAEEESKFGITCEEVLDLVKTISEFPNIHIRGLMTIAPYVVDSEENRWIFRKIKDLSVDINDKNIDNVDMDILSMGMTGDYTVAIEEGATHVRVGTGIFGERNYNV